MKVLYKNEDDLLSVMEVSKATYLPDDKTLQLCGPEEDFGVKVTYKEAEKIVNTLYKEDKADVTDYPYCEIDFFDDDDDDDDDDDFMTDIMNSVDGISFL